MVIDPETQSWSENEFSGSELGNRARTQRLVKMGQRACQRPAGTIVEVFDNGGEREGAYRFVESPHADYLRVGHAAHVATFRRAAKEALVFVPVDGSSLSLAAAKEGSDFGPIGNKWATTLGCHSMNAIAVGADGVPIGPVGQAYWTRPKRERKSRKASYGEGKKAAKRYRPIEEKETRHWGTVIDQAMGAAKEAGFQGRLWFQFDAGADFFEMLAAVPTLDAWTTIRVAHPNRTMWEQDIVLSEAMAQAPLRGTYELSVPSGPNRTARTATMEVRAGPQVISLRWRADQEATPCPLYVVHTRETSPVPKGEEPTDWLLFTTRPVTSLADALEVIQGYTKRWRIEETHKAWKSVTKIEDSALESAAALFVWATILYSVALRIERLKYLSRSAPAAPATDEFTPDEIEAIHHLKKTPPPLRKATITMATAVRYVAELGGYTSPKSSGGPPGTITIGRGLKRVTELAAILPELRGKT